MFLGQDARVLYIGKAKNLRSRVRSYFQAGCSDERVYLPSMVSQIVDCTTLVTQTEKEAAILENSLIKQHQPQFNVKLRDDKEYLNLRLDPRVEWPRLDLVRRAKPDGARYFGPYHSATAARRTLHLVEKHFKLRTCSDRELRSRKRPCLKYQIKRCPAPCVFEVSKDAYDQQVAAVDLFLAGRHDRLTQRLKDSMATASEALQYELAATYRDQWAAVESIRQTQRVVSTERLDQDVIGMYREGDLVEISTLIVREGRVVEAISRSNRRVEVPGDEVIAAYLRQTYAADGENRPIPDRLLLPMLPDGAAGVAEWLTERRGELAAARGERAPRKVELTCPVRGPRKELLEMAHDNARHAFDEKRRAADDIDERLARLQERLRLPTLPRRIECADISHLGGEDTVGSVVAILDGNADKKRYRTYRVRRAVQGDDYAAMYEVLSRRFRRGRDTKEKKGRPAPDPDESGQARIGQVKSDQVRSDSEADWELPDLFVVDGGKGQLAIALAAARDLGLFDLKLAGLAKERENTAGDKLVDRVYLPDQKNPIPLRPNSPELFLLAQARDEAHRFANAGRKRLGKARRMQSQLDRVPGIGPKAKQQLLTHFGGIDNIRSATSDELLALPGIDRRHVSALECYWAAEESTAPEPEELEG
jgi:excinuclease ABC subunit C